MNHVRVDRKIARARVLAHLDENWGAILAANPQHAAAHFNLGCMSANRGDHADAAASFATVMQIDPSDRDAQLHLAEEHSQAMVAHLREHGWPRC